MIPRHIIYCNQCPDSVVEAGSNARERKPPTVSHEFTIRWLLLKCWLIFSPKVLSNTFKIYKNISLVCLCNSSAFRYIGQDIFCTLASLLTGQLVLCKEPTIDDYIHFR